MVEVHWHCSHRYWYTCNRTHLVVRIFSNPLDSSIFLLAVYNQFYWEYGYLHPCGYNRITNELRSGRFLIWLWEN